MFSLFGRRQKVPRDSLVARLIREELAAADVAPHLRPKRARAEVVRRLAAAGYTHAPIDLDSRIAAAGRG